MLLGCLTMLSLTAFTEHCPHLFVTGFYRRLTCYRRQHLETSSSAKRRGLSTFATRIVTTEWRWTRGLKSVDYPNGSFPA